MELREKPGKVQKLLELSLFGGVPCDWLATDGIPSAGSF